MVVMGVYLAEPIADTIAVCTTASMFYVSEVVEEKTIQEEKRILNVLRILVDKLRTLFRI